MPYDQLPILGNDPQGSFQNVGDRLNAGGVGDVLRVDEHGALHQNNNKTIQWVEITPEHTEWSFTSEAANTQQLNPSTIPDEARYLLCDVFMTSSQDNHFTCNLGRSVSDIGGTSWVYPRGTQPSSYFSPNPSTRMGVDLVYPGEYDGFSPVYGIWFSSQIIPSNGRTIYFGTAGKGTTVLVWLYIRTRAYSL